MINRQKVYLYLFLLIIASLCFYINNQYSLQLNPIQSIEIVFSQEVGKKDIPIIYTTSKNESKINFDTVYKFQETKPLVYQSNLVESNKTRKLRLYFAYPNRKVSIERILIKTKDKAISVQLKKLKSRHGINCSLESDKLTIDVIHKNAYIELPNEFIYYSDFKNIYQLIIPFLVIFLLIIVGFKSLKPIDIGQISISSITVSLLVLSVFMPAPIYNIALILMAILNLKRTSWKALKNQKFNILIIGFFTIYVLNNLLISEEGYHQMSTIERFVPFIVLTLILPSISDRKYLSLFPISALAIGFLFLLTSIFDVYIHQNFVFLSFDFFSKYLHPVYFSYLLFFSISYIELNYKGKDKYILEFILFLFLIFSGSKMVFIFSLLVVFINLLWNKKTALLILPLAIIVVLFSPLKNRFDDILKKEDLTILNETHIEDPFDDRINGLTLRLILWRETLATMQGLDYIIGKGVSKYTDKLLENRLYDLGLKDHLGFNPHNQYVDTFWRTGIIGLLLLICIPVFGLINGIRNKDRLLVQFSLFLLVVMCSESIFGRVNGVYFFTVTILILMNSKKINEDSYFRNQRNTQ